MTDHRGVEHYRAMLFPYADATEISGLSTEGIYVLGDKKSIAWVKNHVHRSKQLEQYHRAYEQRLQVLEAEIARLQNGK